MQPQNATSHGQEKATTAPTALDWLLPGTIKSYDEIGSLSNSGQINPYMYTTSLAKFAEDKGAKIIYGSAKQLKYKEKIGVYNRLLLRTMRRWLVTSL